MWRRRPPPCAGTSLVRHCSRGCLQSREEWVLSLHITPGYIHAAVASNHFGAGLAARMDRNHLMTSLFLFAVLAFLVSALCRLFLTIAADASRSGRAAHRGRRTRAR